MHEQEEGVLGQQVFPGIDGIPYRTRNGVPNLKHDDPEKKKPVTVVDMHVDQLDMSISDDAKKLQHILNLCSRSKGYVSKQLETYDPGIKSWRVLLVWGEFFLEDPAEAQDDAGHRRIYH